ncbi:hypothetical protein BV20DRAFT_492706 [Pilatotrama ljubarskyi]|nr:hypothetical protein BV20DRAFT_492706 [Pilatotrama ljubarskyi]
MSAQSEIPKHAKHAPDAADKVATDSPVHPAFSSPNADIVLRSKDGTLFRISSETLSRTSAWFRSMLSLPQGTATPSPEADDAIPTDESAAVLAALLSMISGIEVPDLDDADLLQSALAAAEKYEMPMATSVIRTALFSPFLEISPIRLYGIACRMSWERETTHAARRTLSLNLLSPESLPELVRLEPAHQSNLLTLHRRRRDAFVAGLDDPALFNSILRSAQDDGGPADDGADLCHNPLDHSTWWALKYSLLKQFEDAPPGEELGPTFYRMPEVGAMYAAKCGKCGQANYVMQNVLDSLSGLVRGLPRA